MTHGASSFGVVLVRDARVNHRNLKPTNYSYKFQSSYNNGPQDAYAL